jgi:hypothetical protein
MAAHGTLLTPSTLAGHVVQACLRDQAGTLRALDPPGAPRRA